MLQFLFYFLILYFWVIYLYWSHEVSFVEQIIHYHKKT